MGQLQSRSRELLLKDAFPEFPDASTRCQSANQANSVFHQRSRRPRSQSRLLPDANLHRTGHASSWSKTKHDSQWRWVPFISAWRGRKLIVLSESQSSHHSARRSGASLGKMQSGLQASSTRRIQGAHIPSHIQLLCSSLFFLRRTAASSPRSAEISDCRSLHPEPIRAKAPGGRYRSSIRYPSPDSTLNLS